jgi:hypothetical protein
MLDHRHSRDRDHRVLEANATQVITLYPNYKNSGKSMNKGVVLGLAFTLDP